MTTRICFSGFASEGIACPNLTANRPKKSPDKKPAGPLKARPVVMSWVLSEQIKPGLIGIGLARIAGRDANQTPALSCHLDPHVVPFVSDPDLEAVSAV
jgi:hypothetical protein